MAKKALNKLNKRIHSMATKKRKRRSTRSTGRKRTTSRARTTRRRSTRRRKQALSSGGGGGSRNITWAKALATSGGGAVGGALYAAPQFFLKMPLWGKALYAVAASVGAAKMKAPSVGAGVAGAFVYDAAKTMLGVSLKDEADYVDPSTLSDSGYMDQNGNAVMMDDAGNIYALQDNGEYIEAGILAELEDNMQQQSMLPLADPYALQDAYALAQASGY